MTDDDRPGHFGTPTTPGSGPVDGGDGDNGDNGDDGDEDLPFPLSGTTLVVGPSNVGKTTLTARALERWVGTHGSGGVVVLDFGPELRRDGRLLGGRLARFTDLLDGLGDREESSGGEASVERGDRTTVRRSPDGLWLGLLDAHAPRAESATDAEAVALARENARGAARLFDRVPAGPRAVFVNDATIALQHPAGDVDRLLAYCSDAAVAVVNAFESDELGTDDPVSRAEARALEALAEGADRVVRLP
jgi:hypothetical protein